MVFILIDLLKWQRPAFFTAKLIFLLVINDFTGLSYLLLAWLTNDGFENSIIPSTFISGTSYCKKKFSLFSLCYLFICFFECAGSSLLHMGFLWLRWSGRLLSSCSVQASHCNGFSCHQAWTLRHMDFSSCGTGACCPAACGIFWDQWWTLCPLH